jgi:hypothetical protein
MRAFVLREDDPNEELRLAPGHVRIGKGEPTPVAQPQVLAEIDAGLWPNLIEVKEASDGKGTARRSDL